MEIAKYFPQLKRLLYASLLSFSVSITTFGQNEQPALYGILLDNSGSLRGQIDRVLELGKELVEATHKQGPVSLFSFKGEGNPNDPRSLAVSHTTWTQDNSVISKYLDELYTEGGQTTLRDAIHFMVQQINARAESEAKPGMNKVLVLITDGEDRTSKIKEIELVAELQQHGIRVYAIGLVRDLDIVASPIKNSKQKAILFLDRITRETGGRLLLPRTNNDEAGSLVRNLFVSPR